MFKSDPAAWETASRLATEVRPVAVTALLTLSINKKIIQLLKNYSVFNMLLNLLKSYSFFLLTR